VIVPDDICSHMKPSNQCLRCAQADAAHLRGILRDMHTCLPDMPSVALQTLHTAVAMGVLNER
jgi:hypothetical protein